MAEDMEGEPMEMELVSGRDKGLDRPAVAGGGLTVAATL